jgi:hypothetical protein
MWMFVVAGILPSFAHAGAPQICWDSRNPDAAYLLNVGAALHDAGIRAIQIRKESGGRSPMYLVVTNTGARVRVSCDDSGDGDCACSVEN